MRFQPSWHHQSILTVSVVGMLDQKSARNFIWFMLWWLCMAGVKRLNGLCDSSGNSYQIQSFHWLFHCYIHMLFSMSICSVHFCFL